MRGIVMHTPGSSFVWLSAIGSLLLASCGGESGLTAEIPAHCNPLGGVACITPWPSSVYEVDDATSLTGRRLAVEEGALPVNVDDIPIDPAIINDRDGFS
ncbi:MAG TPA: hypothetical protein VML75_10440, partial [Kofleriaceae bacterium]|nr:hypothetical protein [Kofleriaceae bacterium]